ncbi:dehydrogenase/reductase SDR family member 7B-like [Tachypleus tridentatus]
MHFSVHSECFQKVIGHFKKLDILVNNAGRSQRATFDGIFTEVDYQIFGTNVFSHVSLTRVVLPHFLSNGGGHVMVNSSVAGKCGWSCRTALDVVVYKPGLNFCYITKYFSYLNQWVYYNSDSELLSVDRVSWCQVVKVLD